MTVFLGVNALVFGSNDVMAKNAQDQQNKNAFFGQKDEWDLQVTALPLNAKAL